MLKYASHNFFKIQNKDFTVYEFFKELYKYDLYNKIVSYYYQYHEKYYIHSYEYLYKVMSDIFTKYNIPIAIIDKYLNNLNIYANGGSNSFTIKIMHNNCVIFSFTIHKFGLRQDYDAVDTDDDSIFEYYVYDMILELYYNSICYCLTACNKIQYGTYYNDTWRSEVGKPNRYVKGYIGYMPIRENMKTYYKTILSLPLADKLYAKKFLIDSINEYRNNLKMERTYERNI